MSKSELTGLYLITNDDPFTLLIEKLNQALNTGQICLLQYRRKQCSAHIQYQEIEQILALCQSLPNEIQVPLIINDNIEQAAYFGCGVHLGQSDGEIAEARARLAQGAIIGRTCLNNIDLAHQAITQGADYVAFGAVYPSSTKHNTSRVSIELLQQAKHEINRPICAIGGLSVENAQPVIDAGVDLYAVIGDILNRDCDQISHRIEQWSQLINYK